MKKNGWKRHCKSLKKAVSQPDMFGAVKQGQADYFHL